MYAELQVCCIRSNASRKAKLLRMIATCIKTSACYVVLAWLSDEQNGAPHSAVVNTNKEAGGETF